MDPFIVSIRFNPVGKAYHFDAAKVPDLKSGEFVVVETTRGWQLGQVVEIVQNPVITGRRWLEAD